MVSSSDREHSGPSSVNGSPCNAPAPVPAWDPASLHIIAACRKREQPCSDASETLGIQCKRPRSSEDAPAAAQLPTCIAQVGTSAAAAAAASCLLPLAQKLPRLPRLKLRIKLPGSSKPTSSDELSSSPDGSSMSDSASQQQCHPEPAAAAAAEALETSTPEQVQEPAAAAEDDAADAAAMPQAAIAPEQVQPQQQPQAQQELQQQAQAEPAAQPVAQPLSVLDAVLAAGGWDSYVQQKAWQQQDNPYLAQPRPQHQHQQAEETPDSPHHHHHQHQQQPLGALGDGLALDQAMGGPSSSSALLHPLIPAALSAYNFPYACYGLPPDFSAFVPASPDQSSDQCDMDSEDGDDGFGGADSDGLEYDLFGDPSAPGAPIVPTAQLPCLRPASALLKPALKKASAVGAAAAAAELDVQAAASGDAAGPAAGPAAASPAAEAGDATCPAEASAEGIQQQAGSSVPAARQARVRFHACLEHVRVFDKLHPACCHL